MARFGDGSDGVGPFYIDDRNGENSRYLNERARKIKKQIKKKPAKKVKKIKRSWWW